MAYGGKMNIFLMGNMAFVSIGKNYLLCIGSRIEVLNATPEQLVELIEAAVAWSKFRAIETDNHVRH